MGNVEVRKNKEGYELNLNTLIYSELLKMCIRDRHQVEKREETAESIPETSIREHIVNK